MEHIANQITLRGSLLQLPEFSHENHGRKFYRFFLEVPRLSGTVDTLPIIAEEATLTAIDPTAGEMLTVCGQVRSHNIRLEERRKLLIFVFASAIVCEDGEPLNDVAVQGTLCREPICRRTPLGREICDVMLAVKRSYNRCDYLPCILWGRTAQQAGLCHIGDTLQICGRLQSRSYTKQLPTGNEERITYEISALTAQMADRSDF
jgi:single-stranded DNA-binding protein